MQIPDKPPTWEQLHEGVPPSRLMDVFMSSTGEPLEEYYHWDEIRHRQPPSGLSLNEWWLGIKLRRQTLYRHLALEDIQQRKFRYFTTDSMLAVLHDLDMRAGGSVGMPDQVTNPETRDQYHVSSLMDEAITSSQLEGAAVTREVARDMLRAGRRPRDEGEQMILNNYRTMRQLAVWKDEPLTQELVFDIHRLITDRTLKDPAAAGRFRRAGKPIQVEDDSTGEALHIPPPAGQLPRRMKLMCEFANAPDGDSPFLHPIMRAIMLHFWLAYDHPFEDGNGRTARALFYWLMLRRGFWLFEFISISQFLVKAPVQYARSFLFTETDDNDLNYFLIPQLKIIRQAVDALHGYIERKTREMREISAHLRKLDHLNHRQVAILNRAIRHPGTIFTIESHRSSHAVVYETARRDLEDLVQHGFLMRRRRGKVFVFEAAPKLAAKLKLPGRR